MFTWCMVHSAPKSVLIRARIPLVNILLFVCGIVLIPTARLITIRLRETIPLATVTFPVSLLQPCQSWPS